MQQESGKVKALELELEGTRKDSKVNYCYDIVYLLSKYLVLEQTVYLVCVQWKDHIWLQFINCSLLLVLACNMLKFRHADGEAFSVVRFCLHLIPSILCLCLLLVDKQSI